MVCFNLLFNVLSSLYVVCYLGGANSYLAFLTQAPLEKSIAVDGSN